MMRRKHPASRGRRRAKLRLWPAAATRRRWRRRLAHTPPNERVLLGLVAAALLALAINALYQVIRKPTELFFPVSGVLYKNPEETWRAYAPLFERDATGTISAPLLAALAQVEASGNPLARTYWRWSWSTKPFELYRPASSAVGMYQITDGTFAEARHYCIHHHVLVHEGPWNDWRSCWFNNLYLRVVPSDAVELTAAYLDLKVTGILAQYPNHPATSVQKQHLAALVHLCGEGAAAAYARAGFHLSPGERCGEHDAHAYLARVDEMTSVFAHLATEERRP